MPAQVGQISPLKACHQPIAAISYGKQEQGKDLAKEIILSGGFLQAARRVVVRQDSQRSSLTRPSAWPGSLLKNAAQRTTRRAAVHFTSGPLGIFTVPWISLPLTRPEYSRMVEELSPTAKLILSPSTRAFLSGSSCPSSFRLPVIF